MIGRHHGIIRLEAVAFPVLVWGEPVGGEMSPEHPVRLPSIIEMMWSGEASDFLTDTAGVYTSAMSSAGSGVPCLSIPGELGDIFVHIA